MNTVDQAVSSFLISYLLSQCWLVTGPRRINVLALGRCGNDITSVIVMLQIEFLHNSCEIALRCISQNPIDDKWTNIVSCNETAQIVMFMGPTWGPPGSCRPQMGPMLAPWTLLSGSVDPDLSCHMPSPGQGVLEYSRLNKMAAKFRDISTCFLLNENDYILIIISLKFVAT